jgi:hypothetical protein
MLFAIDVEIKNDTTNPATIATKPASLHYTFRFLKDASNISCNKVYLGNSPFTTASAIHRSKIWVAGVGGRKHIAKDSNCILALMRRKMPNGIALGRETFLSDKSYNSTTFNVCA